MVEIRIAVTEQEKEAVYRSRCTASHDRADDRRPALVDPEDENSWFIHAVGTDGEIAGSYRVTRGSDGFSLRQIARYELEPFLAELPPRLLAVIERLVVSPTWSDDDLSAALILGARQIPGWDGVLVVFGDCSRQLLARGLPFERIYQPSTASRREHDDLVRVIAFPQGPESLIGLGHGPGLPTCIEHLLRTSGGADVTPSS
jgi:hypothetical protein